MDMQKLLLRRGEKDQWHMVMNVKLSSLFLGDPFQDDVDAYIQSFIGQSV